MTVLLGATTTHAQFLGIAGLLNPEGSRLFPQAVLYPRHPGKPDPRWRSFEWRFLDKAADSSRYRLYFYEDENWSARFAMPRIRQQIGELSQLFSYSPPKPFSYLLFTSHREFKQANIFFISEGVQGITSTQEATMAIPYWGEAQTFDHISKHELVHQFQVQKIHELGKGMAMSRMQLVPLWFIEGMAEYLSLEGVDEESRVYLRDALLNERKDKGYTVPKLFEEGQMGFVATYKFGQAKIDFFETKYGKGITQKLLSAAAQHIGDQYLTFAEFVSAELGTPIEVMEESWQSYLKLTYRPEADRHKQMVDPKLQIQEAGDTLDYFDVSPNGEYIGIRQIDPLSGVASIQVIDLKNGNKKHKVAEDSNPGLLSLYFMQGATMTLSNGWIGYVVETSSGPELETRQIVRDGKSLEFGPARRLKLHDLQLREASSVAFSPDEKDVAIVALDQRGWQNVYVIDGYLPGSRSKSYKLRPVTEGYYSWRNLNWTPEGIVAASDRTGNGKYALFRVSPEGRPPKKIAGASDNLLEPATSRIGENTEIVFQSWANGSPQAAMIKQGQAVQITSVKTGIFRPKLTADSLYGLIFIGGRYQLYRIPRNQLLADDTKITIPNGGADYEDPWVVTLDPIPTGQVMDYRPFSKDHGGGVRIDNLAGFFASGGYLGFTGAFSDLMRNYQLTADIFMLGNINQTSASLFLSSSKGRATWTVGGYRTIQPRIDSEYSNGTIETYLQREFGALAAVQYPMGAFSYFDLGLRVGGVDRDDFSNALLAPTWNAANPGLEFMVAPTARLGYDAVLYEAFTGPLKGFGALIEADTSYFPARAALSERLRLDVAQYYQLTGRTILAFNVISAAAFGDRFRNSFLVSSDDIMRAYMFNDARLYGNYLLAGKVELRFPIGSLFNFPPLRGLLAYDVGSVFVQPGTFNDRIASSTTGGLTLNIPPLSINLMVSHPLRTAPGPVDNAVTHFTLRYLYI